MIARQVLESAIAAAAVAGAMFVVTAGSALARDTLVMQSIYAGSVPLLGDSGRGVAARVAELTDGELTIDFRDPGALVRDDDIWEAVSSGWIDAAWYSPAFAQNLVPAAALFTAVPFGPGVREYVAWYYEGGGHELWNEIAAAHNVHSELCAVQVPEASGWFREPIETLADLKGKRIRIFGLGAKVLERLGVEPQSLSPAQTIEALRAGTLDGAEMSFPAIDLALGMPEHARHYYFPGWHQQTALISFIVNRDRWEGLAPRHRAVIREVCAANVALSMARGESVQARAIAELRKQGVQLHRWSPELIEAFRGAWNEVAALMAANDADFRRVWEQLGEFRKRFADWSQHGYLQ